MSDKLKNRVTVLVIGSFFLVFFVWCLLKPTDAVSESERRTLAAMPEWSFQSFFGGTFTADFEDYATDQFPLRDTFRTAKAVTSFYLLGQRDTNDLYLADGHISQLEYPMDTDSLDNAAKKFAHIYEKYLSNAKVYFSVVPDKNCFLAESNGYPSMDYDEFVSYLTAQADFMTYIDIFPLLSADDYYRTDIHWRQEALTDVAQALAAGMGVRLSAQYDTVTSDEPFYGVYYGRAALPLSADRLSYLTNDLLDACTVYDYETDTVTSVYDTEKASGRDPYELFLSGSKSLLTLTNPDATSDRRLIVFRDSFGSSLVPLLAEGYAEITLVDIRYISSEALGNYVNFEDCDVLFLYSTAVLNNSITFK